MNEPVDTIQDEVRQMVAGVIGPSPRWIEVQCIRKDGTIHRIDTQAGLPSTDICEDCTTFWRDASPMRVE